jgi:ATP-dependent RNA helicase DeaD
VCPYRERNISGRVKRTYRNQEAKRTLKRKSGENLKTFEELGVNEEIRRAIAELGYEQPMPVQEEVIPYLLGNGNDVIALAQTGTGKTAAYGLPLLQKCDARNHETQAVVLCPTRELCLQITDDLNNYSKFIDGMHIVAVYGGASIETQIHAIKHGVQIIVATPGRLIDLMKRGVAKLNAVNNVVLDEADEMLNMGFSESINEIFAGVPKYRNTLLFSATMSKEIEKIAQNYLHDYKEIVVGSRNEGAENVNHIYYMVNAKDKYLALKRIVDFNPRIYAIIFCRTKNETQEIADKLIRDGYNAESLHGDLSQQQRDLTMQKFRNHLTQLLVATDVAARGLDVEDLTHVINYGLPDDIENYTHRSGRTGRAGKKGTSISIIHTRERGKVRAIEKEIGKQFVEGEIPNAKDICTKQLYKVITEIEQADVNEEEIAQFLPEIYRRFDCMEKEDLIKKVVSREFGRFLAYYANATEIEKPTGRGDRGDRGGRGDRSGRGGDRGGDRRRGSGGPRTPEKGYKRLFINLGKEDHFMPGRVMSFINEHVSGHPEVGHIDLFGKFSYVEVPESDASRVMSSINGVDYEGRTVRCNEADSVRPSGGGGDRGGDRGSRGGYGDRGGRGGDRGGRGGYGIVVIGDRGGRSDRGGHGDRSYGKSSDKSDKPRRSFAKKETKHQEQDENVDWRQFFKHDNGKLKGEEPDFSEEGWARRKSKKDDE